jgi:hypothetical protein
MTAAHLDPDLDLVLVAREVRVPALPVNGRREPTDG